MCKGLRARGEPNTLKELKDGNYSIARANFTIGFTVDLQPC